MSVPIAYLRDDFADNLQASAWGLSSVTGSATKAETVGQARFTLPSSTAGSHDARYVSSTTYDVTGDGCFINIDTMVATGVAATAFFALLLDTDNYLIWTQTSGTLKAQTVVAGVTTDRYSVSWSSSTYKYLRIRESGGNVLFDSSSNGTSWTNRASVAAPFAVTALSVRFGALCGNVASPGSFRIEEFNTILPALTTNWHWTQVEWPLQNRFLSITIAATSGQGYIVTADSLDSSGNLVSPRYYSGPIGSSSGGYNSLTLQSSQAAAEAMAVNLPLNGRWDLPSLDECRIIRLYHRSTTGSSYTLREYYPRRLVQSDDVEAESIKAINIAAQSITADKLFVLQLSAITANMGTLTMDGPIDITTGSIIGGGGVLTLDSSGLSLEVGSSYADISAYRLENSGGTLVTGLGATYAAGTHSAYINIPSITGNSSGFQTVMTAPSGKSVEWRVDMTNSTNTMLLRAIIDVPGSRQVFTFDGGGLDVGNSGGAIADGQIRTSENVAIGDGINSATRLRVKGSDSSSSNYALVLVNSSNTALMAVRNDSRIGFLGATEVARQTVSGSRGGNAALASLLTALANFGLITDSTSA